MIAPDAPSHNRTRVVSVNELDPVQDRVEEAKCPRTAWPVRAMTKRWAYAARRDRADALSQQWGSHTAAAAAAVAVDASKMFPCLADISASLRRRQAGDPSQDRAFLDRKAAVSHKTRTWAAARRVEGDTEDLQALRA